MARLVTLGILFGVLIGVGMYTFVYAKGYSYMTNDPSACANCHVMREYYDAWQKSSHRNVAACNDCHTPHDFFGKYAVKATNGFFHSLYFTTGKYPDNIQIRGYNRKVTEGACKHCHEGITHDIVAGRGEQVSCVRCHASAGHYHYAADNKRDNKTLRSELWLRLPNEIADSSSQPSSSQRSRPSP
jgi:cytochrome c nitrite reductase small subunit